MRFLCYAQEWITAYCLVLWWGYNVYMHKTIRTTYVVTRKGLLTKKALIGLVQWADPFVLQTYE